MRKRWATERRRVGTRRTRMTPRQLVLGLASLATALTLTACTDAPDSRTSSGSSSSPTVELMDARAFTLRPAHCWFEPVTIEGQVWHVEPADQFGWGDAVRWQGKGVLRQVAGDHLVFVDATGRRIDLWPDGHPKVAVDDDAPPKICM